MAGTVKIGDVARRAGVSTATVSRTLSSPHTVRPETRKLVLDAVRELGYTPNAAARNLRAGRSRILLVVVPYLSSSFFARIVSGIDLAAANLGYGIILAEKVLTGERQAELINLASAGLFDGALLLSSLVPRSRNRILTEVGLPIVRVCATAEQGLPTILLADREASREGTRHLLGLGHRRLLYLSGGRGNVNDVQRYAGFCEALAEAGLGEADHVRLEGDYEFASGSRAAETYLSMRSRGPVPTGIVSAGDQMAIGFMKGVQEAGLIVPRDLSIVGFDGIEFTNFCHPTMTTIVQPAEDMGAAAAELLISLLKNEDGPEEIVFPGTLRIGGSTGPAPTP